MLKGQLTYADYLTKIFDLTSSDKDKNFPVLQITFQVTDACNLRCSYCYQIEKNTNKMTFEVAKKFIDYMFDNYNNPNNHHFYKEKTKGLIIDFIGGEPFLEIELIEKIVNYFEYQFFQHLDYSWTLYHAYNFGSNGTLYFQPKVQNFLNKYQPVLSGNITVDGVKEYHDTCRLFPDKRGSYDLALEAALDWGKKTSNYNTKITIAPENVDYIFDAIKNMYSLGFQIIHINCVYENVWKTEDATKIYYQGKKIVDWLIENPEIEDNIYIAPLDTYQRYSKKTFCIKSDDQNWCGGASSSMLALDYKGDIFTCIRFMKSSLGQDQPEYIIGNIEHGIGYTEEEKERLNTLNNCTLKGQSTEKCINCPIGTGCGWCSGYNYQIYGTINKRATFICQTHIAWALVAYYYEKKTHQNNIKLPPDEMALEVISLEELNNLKKEE